MLITHLQYKIKNILKHEIINEHWTNISFGSINFVSRKHLENNWNHWNLQIIKSWKTVFSSNKISMYILKMSLY